MSFLELDGLAKSYGNLTVVKNVNLSVDKGKLVCLLGPSGCGKTTTLRLIAGFVPANAGSIRVGGQTVSSAHSTVPPEARNMSMIFQSYALWPHMTVFQNVAYGLKLRKVPAIETAARVRTILAATQLTPLEDRYPGELSGGQQQRVSLARALVVKPEILLLDEPLSNLDANLREEMRFEIRRLHDEFRYTTVYVTHDQVEAMTTADIIVVMNDGRIEQAGSPEDIYQRPQTEFVARFIGGTNILKGQKGAGDVVVCDGDIKLRCASGEFAAQGQTAVSIRHHDIRLSEKKPTSVDMNWATGTVSRQIYLGSHRDYLVSLTGGETVRTIAPVDVAIPVGQQVWLNFPPDSCRALAQ
ncbi:ABC transporter ATP-binding protein [Pseudaminobacter arsenicus]|uniref:ABC transporter ATP-binding protein n=1 Tax=Borborobacter arsenicus TaxID=1851146 RepID=A0A432V430_9HYPH|nr:ABC transporter ATP-binding protein [Pseudaminobacter arsenicus]RUM96993.1 ABC transporter ATP-binding protein [Pseudaminobacter arsenicus]